MRRTHRASTLYEVSERRPNLFPSPLLNNGDDYKIFTGLADTLRSEMLLYDIKVQIFLPNTILSPGYERENIRKPDITSKIEEGDSPVKPDVAAASMLAGSQCHVLPKASVHCLEH